MIIIKYGVTIIFGGDVCSENWNEWQIEIAKWLDFLPVIDDKRRPWYS
jgi:hypothetical protein